MSTMADESQWFQFRPIDEQIFGYYLKRLLTKGPPLPAMARGVIREIDIYGEVPPWEIAKQFPESSRDNFYVFTKLVKLSTNRFIRTAKNGKGTWKGQSKKKDFEASGWGADVVGKKKCLSFMMDVEGQPQGTKKKQVTSHWNITEYSLTKINGNKIEDAYVICHVTNSNRTSSLAQEAHNNTVNADTLRSIRAKRPKPNPNPNAHAGHLQQIGHTALPARDDARFGVYFETEESSSPCRCGGSCYDDDGQLWVGYDHDGQICFGYDQQQQQVNEGAVAVHQFHTGDEASEYLMRLDTVVDDGSAAAAAGGSGAVIAARGEDETTTTAENNNNNTESTTWQGNNLRIIGILMQRRL